MVLEQIPAVVIPIGTNSLEDVIPRMNSFNVFVLTIDVIECPRHLTCLKHKFFSKDNLCLVLQIPVIYCVFIL